MKYYAVVFDRMPLKSYKEFHDELVSHPEIKTWWHYIKTMYFIGTNLSANDLSDHVANCLKENSLNITHIVIKVDLNDRQGRLVPDAWKWMKKNS